MAITPKVGIATAGQAEIGYGLLAKVELPNGDSYVFEDSNVGFESSYDAATCTVVLGLESFAPSPRTERAIVGEAELTG